MERIAKLIFEFFFVPRFFIFSSLNVYFLSLRLYFNYAIFMFAVFIIYLNVYMFIFVVYCLP